MLTLSKSELSYYMVTLPKKELARRAAQADNRKRGACYKGPPARARFIAAGKPKPTGPDVDEILESVTIGVRLLRRIVP